MEEFDAIYHRRRLHEIPEAGFSEFKTQAYLLSYLESLPQDHLTIQPWRTGLFVFITGHSPVRTLAYRADIDGLPVTEETGYDFASKHSGFMHACGHDFHMAIALGLVTHYSYRRPKDNLLFVFQPAEEGPGGALGMAECEFFRAHKPDLIFAFHVKPDLKVGEVGVAPGVFFANTSEVFIELKGKGGHAATPHLGNDMVVAAAHLVAQLQTIVARNANPLETAVITIGQLEAGTRQNIIAEHAHLSGTMRTLDDRTMELLQRRVKEIVRGIEVGFTCQASIDWGAQYAAVVNEPAVTNQFMEFVRGETGYEVVSYPASMVGEDFGFFLKEVPGFIAWLGVEGEFGLHSSHFDPDEKALAAGMEIAGKYLDWLQKGTG